MAIRRKSAKVETSDAGPKGFDDFDVRLGDLMRGERATLGKSLLDVEREIRIKASYIAAIENTDPDAFDTPGFIPGYVRSYARYLRMDPDAAFSQFCAEAGFSVAHGMSAGASSIRKPEAPVRKKTARKTDPLVSPSTPFLPASESILARVEPGAIGSALVLVALIGAIGFGGWSVLNEIQRVQFAPVENTPDVMTDLDPVENALPTAAGTADDPVETAGVFQPPAEERLDRLYRPEALDVPVMVARDAPISTLDPAEVGTFSPLVATADSGPAGQTGAPGAEPLSAIDAAVAAAVGELPTPQVSEGPLPAVRMVAVRPAWVRVRGADGSVIYETIMNAGDTWDVPATEEPPTLRVGESGAVYFTVNGRHYGPAGPKGSVTSDLPLAAAELSTRYEIADLEQDQDLLRYVAELQTGVQPQD